jgi:peptide/nickel transport system permease protein
VRLVSRIERRFEADTIRPIPLRWLSNGKLVSVDPVATPVLFFGADSLGRDIFARLLYGSRVSLGVAVVATLGALFLAAVIGIAAGYLGGTVDDTLMRGAELVLVLPTIYVVLGLRAAMPLVMPASTTFILVAAVLALVGWPFAARGVRAIVASELRRDYIAAAKSLGASDARLLAVHVLPATFGFLAVQVTLLLPAFILAEATLSFVGLGFAEPTPSWGSMLREAANIRALAEFPWLAAPALLIALVVLGFNLLLESGPRSPSDIPRSPASSSPVAALR